MNSQHTSEDGAKSSTSNFIGLMQIVQNLITLGLNSISLWNTVSSKLKNHDDIASHPELANLQLLLVQISQHLSSRVFEFFPMDLSEHKLETLLEKEIPSKSLLKTVRPLLKKKNFVDRLFSIESSNTLNSTVEDILKSLKHNTIESADEESTSVPPPTREQVCESEDDILEIVKTSNKRQGPSAAKTSAKKQRIERSSSLSDQGSDSSNDETCLSESGDDSDCEDKFDKLF